MNERYFDTGLKTVDNDIITFEIFNVLARKVKDLYVANEGPDKMFVRTYTEKLWPTKECWIYPWEMRRFHNVYKILIAKTPMGNQYHISEFNTGHRRSILD